MIEGMKQDDGKVESHSTPMMSLLIEFQVFYKSAKHTFRPWIFATHPETPPLTFTPGLFPVSLKLEKKNQLSYSLLFEISVGSFEFGEKSASFSSSSARVESLFSIRCHCQIKSATVAEQRALFSSVWHFCHNITASQARKWKVANVKQRWEESGN